MAHVTDQLKVSLADRYVIERELGAGGMATVFLAHDVKHNRKVALKVLRPELAAVIGAERFLKEIEVTANLQHPHILPLFDSGEAGSFLYYVMPHIEGQTLRDKLDQEKQLGVEDAVEISRSVASALDYAHRQGVIHRDIKPENILIHDGQALVADFGIALALSHAGGNRLTETGLSIGTPHYMSPEQAMGDRELDARSDIYSLGAMLYEMLAGDPPYTGSTAQAIVAKVITEKAPPVTQHRDTVPPHVAAAITKALNKLPADRFKSAAEFAEALGNIRFTLPATSAETALAASAIPPFRRSAVTIALVAFGVIAAAIAAWGWLRTPPASVVRVHLGFPPGQALQPAPTQPFALSPDGSVLAYLGPSADRQPPQIWVRRLSEIEARPLPGTEGALAPFFSPDGQSLGFFTGAPGSLRVVPVGGGPVRTLVTDSVSPWGGAWGKDGDIYFSGPQGSLWTVTSGGGGLRQVGILDSARGYNEHDFPSLLPDGKTALVAGWTSGSLSGAEIAVVDLATGISSPLFQGVQAQYVRTGHIVYATAEGTLMAVPYDVKQRVVTGEPHLLLDGIAVDGSSGAGRFVVSESGTLLYLGGDPAAGSQVLWIDPTDNDPSAADPSWFANITSLALSPDGRRLAVSIGESAAEHIWIKQLDAGPLTRLTFEGKQNYRPAWTPDGRSVTFVSDRTGPNQLWAQRADGSAPAQLLREDPRQIDEGFVSKDGRWLVYRTGSGGARTRDIHAVSVAGSDTTPIALADSPFDEDSPALSPDGRWLAYVSEESGRRQVYVRPFPDAKRAKWQVSIEMGDAPLWAPNGRRLYFVQRG
ncbi:MAG: serine/threonine-protein kinase, partial [Gemmatimonadota bacterium]|nr:serine/threonine-protein kinase [Gemmatimonadota bacterium]